MMDSSTPNSEKVHDFRRRVREGEELWRESQKFWRELAADWTQGELPADFWRWWCRFVEDQRQRARDEFGIELRPPEWVDKILVDLRYREASLEQLVTVQMDLVTALGVAMLKTPSGEQKLVSPVGF